MKINGGSTLETLSNQRNYNSHDIHHNKEPTDNYHTNSNGNTIKSHNQKNIKKSTRKNLIEINSSTNSSDFFKQANYEKDPKDSFNLTRKYTNANVTPMDIVTTFNEKSDLNNNNNDNSPGKTSNNGIANLNPISETKNKLDEDDDKYSPRRTISKGMGSPRKFNSNATNGISSKEKRAILEHYRNLYSFKKQSPSKTTPSFNHTKNNPSFPMISQYNKNPKRNPHIGHNNDFTNIDNNKHSTTIKTTSLFHESGNKDNDASDRNFNSTQKNSMFRSSIYSNLMPTNNKDYKKKYQSLNKYNNSNENESDLNTSLHKLSKSKIKNKPHQTTYGPFLNIDYKFDKKIEIKNPEIKRSLEDINYYGPYFSHCPICRFKNLDFYQTMEPHQCLKLLSYIKLKRSNLHLK